MEYKKKHGLAITFVTGTFERWLAELKRVAVRYFEFSASTDFDAESWRMFYDEGLTPWDAIQADLSEA